MRGNCERASLKKHSINWIHIKIRELGELLDNSKAFNKGVWAELKKIRPMNFSSLNSLLQKKKRKEKKTELNLNKTFALFGHKVFERS